MARSQSASCAHNLQLLAYKSFNSCAPYKPLDLSLFPLPLKLIDCYHRILHEELVLQLVERTSRTNTPTGKSFSADLHFVSCFVQQMFHVLLVTYKAKDLTELLRDCICRRSEIERDLRRTKLFHMLLYICPHNLVAPMSLCLWGGAYRMTSYFL